MKSVPALRVLARSRSGFTLIEMVVATAITAVFAALLIGVTTGIMSVWNRSRGSLTTTNQVKFALDQLALDLEGMITRNDGSVWLAATILDTNNPAASETAAILNNTRAWVISGTGSSIIKPGSTAGVGSPSFVLSPARIEDARFGRAGVWLRFFTTKQDDNSGHDSMSAIAAVSYQLRRFRVGNAGNNNAEVLYVLYRSVVRQSGMGAGQAQGTFQVGYDLHPFSGSVYTAANAGDGNPGNVIQPTRTHSLANNVIDFGVRLYVRENGILRLIFPATPAALASSPESGEPSDSSITVPAIELSHLARYTETVDSNDAYRNRMPDVVEVMLRVLTDEGAQLIQALEAGQSTGDWWTIAEAHSRVYTRRIEIVGKPL